MKKQLFATGFFLFSFMLPFKATAASFTGINVFGDSLVDTGNLFNVAGIPPSPPYAQGRFSNGSIWVDNLAQQLDLTPTLFTQLGSTLPTEGINFAFGGATVTGDNNSSPPGLQQQIGFFKEITTIAPADPNALYIL